MAPRPLLRRWSVTVLERGLPATVVLLWAADREAALARARVHFPEDRYPGANVQVDPHLRADRAGEQQTMHWPKAWLDESVRV
jgi:hypothetical protein